MGGKYNVPHGLANAVIMPHVLSKYGKAIHKKLWRMGVYAGLFSESTSVEDGANMFILKIASLNESMGIPTTITELQREDIPTLAAVAGKEANPLYPVPVIFDKSDFENIFESLLEE